MNKDAKPKYEEKIEKEFYELINEYTFPNCSKNDQH